MIHLALAIALGIILVPFVAAILCLGFAILFSPLALLGAWIGAGNPIEEREERIKAKEEADAKWRLAIETERARAAAERETDDEIIRSL